MILVRMEIEYKYGREVEYSRLQVVKPGDRKKLQDFPCGNKKLDTDVYGTIKKARDPSSGFLIFRVLS